MCEGSKGLELSTKVSRKRDVNVREPKAYFGADPFSRRAARFVICYLLFGASPARTLVAAGAHPFSPFLFHMIGLAACSASAFGGRDLYGE